MLPKGIKRISTITIALFFLIFAFNVFTHNSQVQAADDVQFFLNRTVTGTDSLITLVAENLLPSTNYVFTIEDEGGGPISESGGKPGYHYLSFATGDSFSTLSSKCLDPSGTSDNRGLTPYLDNDPDDSEVIAPHVYPMPQVNNRAWVGSGWCNVVTDSDGTKTFRYRILIQPDTLDCSRTNGKCSIHLREDDGSSFTDIASEIIEVRPSLTVTLEGIPYANNLVTITASGCSGETVEFFWWKNASSEVQACLTTNAEDCGEKYDGEAYDHEGKGPAAVSGTTASIQKKFKDSGRYHLQAVCDSGLVGTTSFSVEATGNSSSKVTAVAADTSQPGTVRVGGTFNIFVGGLGNDECYYVRVQDPDGRFMGDSPTGEEYCTEKTFDDLDDRPFIAASSKWGPNNGGLAVGSITATTTGPYVVYLEKVNDDEGFRNTIGKGRWAEVAAGAAGLVAGFVGGGFNPVTGAAGAAGAAALTNRIIVAIGNAQDEVLSRAIICSGFEFAADCARFPDPKNPPCANDIDADLQGRCNGINTSLGFVISTTPEGLVRSILGLLLSISGIVAVLLIILSGYRFVTSNGNPETVQAARETLTSAIVGLLFIIFSLLILQVITVDILRLPGFASGESRSTNSAASSTENNQNVVPTATPLLPSPTTRPSPSPTKAAPTASPTVTTNSCLINRGGHGQYSCPALTGQTVPTCKPGHKLVKDNEYCWRENEEYDETYNGGLAI